MKKIVTLGEIMLRFSVNKGERLFQAEQLKVNYGGAEANVAVSLANFGHDVYFVSKIPDNSLGTAIERQLKSNGVHTDYLIKGGERLGVYYLETGVGQRSSKVTYDRKYSSFSMMKSSEFDMFNLDKVFSSAELFHVSGITPSLSQSLMELTLFALKSAKEHGVITSFDFNYREKLWSHQKASESIKKLLPFVDICSCSELDAMYILGIDKPKDLFDKAEILRYYYSTIIDMYPNIRYISSTFRNNISSTTNTLQGNYYTDKKLYQSKVYSIDHIVDRVGGGDAFAAGVLHGILENMNPQELISFATAASALKHTVYGDCNVFSADEVITFVNNECGKIVR